MPWRTFISVVVALQLLSGAARGGPPYLTDDPEPTNYRHFEIYLFNAGTVTRFGTGSSAGIDFNYGLAPETQLDVWVPAALTSPLRGPTAVNLGNIQVALKYRFLHQRVSG